MQETTFRCDFCNAELHDGFLAVANIQIGKSGGLCYSSAKQLDFCGTGCMGAFIDGKLKDLALPDFLEEHRKKCAPMLGGE